MAVADNRKIGSSATGPVASLPRGRFHQVPRHRGTQWRDISTKASATIGSFCIAETCSSLRVMRTL